LLCRTQQLLRTQYAPQIATARVVELSATGGADGATTSPVGTDTPALSGTDIVATCHLKQKKKEEQKKHFSEYLFQKKKNRKGATIAGSLKKLCVAAPTHKKKNISTAIGINTDAQIRNGGEGSQCKASPYKTSGSWYQIDSYLFRLSFSIKSELQFLSNRRNNLSHTLRKRYISSHRLCCVSTKHGSGGSTSGTVLFYASHYFEL
jgi:hypothetical protein